MDTRLECDIAYVKAAVSEYARQGTQCDALKARIDRIQEELRDIRSELYHLDMFQTIIKGVLSGIGAVAVMALIVAIFKAAAVGPSNDTTQKTDASRQIERPAS
jgi:hypothetical protein